MNYQQQVDKIFASGRLWKHRTLRTVFDPFSSEWELTTIARKLEILKIIQENHLEISDIIEEYKDFYIEENKIHVVKAVEDGLRILLIHSLKNFEKEK